MDEYLCNITINAIIYSTQSHNYAGIVCSSYQSRLTVIAVITSTCSSEPQDSLTCLGISRPLVVDLQPSSRAIHEPQITQPSYSEPAACFPICEYPWQRSLRDIGRRSRVEALKLAGGTELPIFSTREKRPIGEATATISSAEQQSSRAELLAALNYFSAQLCCSAGLRLLSSSSCQQPLPSFL